ncbi:MAG: HAD hydrolase family protein [Calditrichaeota bacterium]|nr:HAD hydrolase family protein [Calditrichota bacterium]
MTDGQITYTNQYELKSFNSKDGFGITLANAAGIKIGIITARESTIVKKRADELRIQDVHMGQRNKKSSYEEIRKKYGLDHREMAYMGDDILDLPVLKTCGLSAAPADAVHDVKSIVDFVSQFNGGHGAVREFIEYILKAQNRFQQVVDKLLKLEQS